MKQKQYKNGFTFVEVALVLGIAGLIMLATFMTLPTLWANERDGERKDNVAIFIDALKNYETNNNRGALPVVKVAEEGSAAATTGDVEPGTNDFNNAVGKNGTWAYFYKNYLPKNFQDPGGIDYTLKLQDCSTLQTTTDGSCGLESRVMGGEYQDLWVVLSASCDGPDAVRSANPRKVAVVHKLERANQVYCSAM